MNKLAKTKHGIHFLLESRWSPRAFRENGIEKGKLLRLFEAAAWAPSAYNEQPWRFLVGEKGTETYDKILDSLVDTNKRWGKHAPVLVVCMAKKNFSADNRDNFHFLYDTGQAVAHLTFQAAHENLYVHQMAGFHFEKIKNYFAVPDEFYIATVIAIGYIGNPDILEEDLKEIETAERERKDTSETVFTETFGKSWD